jgi:hypothetical protein
MQERLEHILTRLENLEQQMVKKSDLLPTIFAAQLCVWAAAGLALIIIL